MKTREYLKLTSIITALCAIVPATVAQTYNWLSWTFPSSQAASAGAPGGGSVDVSVQGPSTVVLPFTLQFDNVTFTPTTVQAVAPGNGVFGVWTAQIDFTSLSDTSGLILGLGNFGHGDASLPGYRLTAFDRFGAPMSLANFTQIGSYDHTWISPSWPFSFNDDASLNPATGIFEVTTTPGGDDSNSDILLLSLPPAVGHLNVSPIAQSAGETINIVLAVPEPGTVALMVLGVGVLGWLRWRKHAA